MGVRPTAFRPATQWPAGYAGNHPAWQNRSVESLSGLEGRFSGALRPGADGSQPMRSWLQNHPDRAQNYQDWANRVRSRWNDHPTGGQWWSQNHPQLDQGVQNRADAAKHPGNDWWSKDHPELASWYYHNDWNRHDWTYWWGEPTWESLAAWFAAWGWADLWYYDYGPGGNVVYQNEGVFVNGQNVGSADEYAQSAAELATVDQAAASRTQNDQWLPLGTFALVTSKEDTTPSRVIQLAVDKQGIISGTIHNSSTDQSYVVQGKVDKQTQRAAFSIGAKSNVVIETGIYDLTKDQAPVLVHCGPTQTELYLLVRLNPPREQVQQNQPSGTTR